MQFEHHPEKRQFILKINDKENAFVNYIQLKDTFHLTYTEVPLGQRQKGYGRELVSKTFEYLQESHIPYVPVCGFMKAYISHRNRLAGSKS